MAKPSEREVNRTSGRYCSSSFFQQQMIKNIFITCCAKKILSVVRYITPIQVKVFILSGEQRGNVFSIRVRQGDLFSSNYLFKALTKPRRRGGGVGGNHIYFSLWGHFCFFLLYKDTYENRHAGWNLQQKPVELHTVKLIDNLCFCSFRVHLFLLSHPILSQYILSFSTMQGKAYGKSQPSSV